MCPLFAGIEAGGTKFVVAVGTGPDDLQAETRFPTTVPEETIQHTIEFLGEQLAHHGILSGVGISCFGPLDPDPASPTFGHITTTPKPGWANFDIVGAIKQIYQVPVGFDTDVNGAALGEGRWGAAQGLDTFLYLTVGTGIGGGAMVNGKLVHGMLHPEMGHVRIPHDLKLDPFPGMCPYHRDCFEGLACGRAIEARWGQRAETLPPDHPAWELEAAYISLALVNYIYTFSPQRIIIGGGVMQQQHLFPMIRTKVQGLLNNYIQTPQVLKDIDAYIVSPALGNLSGVLGGIALAEAAYN